MTMSIPTTMSRRKKAMAAPLDARRQSYMTSFQFSPVRT